MHRDILCPNSHHAGTVAGTVASTGPAFMTSSLKNARPRSIFSRRSQGERRRFRRSRETSTPFSSCSPKPRGRSATAPTAPQSCQAGPPAARAVPLCSWHDCTLPRVRDMGNGLESGPLTRRDTLDVAVQEQQETVGHDRILRGRLLAWLYPSFRTQTSPAQSRGPPAAGSSGRPAGCRRKPGRGPGRSCPRRAAAGRSAGIRARSPPERRGRRS